MDFSALRIENMRQRSEAELMRLECLLCHSSSILDRTWTRVFSDEERKKLTDQMAADNCRLIHPVAMWQKVRGGSHSSAMIRLARSLNLITQCDHDWLLETIGESSVDSHRLTENATPRWNPDTLELSLAGCVLKHIRSRNVASNVVRVLDEFEENHWPSRIDDPTPNGPDQTRLHATIRSLNSGLPQLRFSADGSGMGIFWKRK